MNWLDQIRSGFPSLHPKEPKDLRRDIEDEIADHLAEATKREMHRHANEDEARTAAIREFGDPRKVARRLWFDAMKEAVMKDRLLLGMMALLVIGMLGMGAMMWSMQKSNREVNESLVAALQTLSDSQKASNLDGMAELTIALMDESTGKPVDGAIVGLKGLPFPSDVEEKVIQAVTDKDGYAVIGPVQMGDYKLCILYPFEQYAFHRTEDVVLYANKREHLEYALPEVRWGMARVDVSLPARISDSRVMGALPLSLTTGEGSNTWTLASFLFFDGESRLLNLAPQDINQFYLTDEGFTGDYWIKSAVRRMQNDLDFSKAQSEFRVPAGNYSDNNLTWLVRNPISDDVSLASATKVEEIGILESHTTKVPIHLSMQTARDVMLTTLGIPSQRGTTTRDDSPPNGYCSYAMFPAVSSGMARIASGEFHPAAATTPTMKKSSSSAEICFEFPGLGETFDVIPGSILKVIFWTPGQGSSEYTLPISLILYLPNTEDEMNSSVINSWVPRSEYSDLAAMRRGDRLVCSFQSAIPWDALKDVDRFRILVIPDRSSSSTYSSHLNRYYPPMLTVAAPDEEVFPLLRK